MKQWLDVKMKTCDLDDDVQIPPEIRGWVFIPAFGVGFRHFHYLVDLDCRRITTWSVDLTRFAAHLKTRLGLPQEARYPWAYHDLDGFLDNSFFPHTAECKDGKIYVSCVAGNFILRLDPDHDDFEMLLCEPESIDKVYSSTNTIHGDALWFQRWRIGDALARAESGFEKSVFVEIGKYDLVSQEVSIVGGIDATDDLHATAVSPDGRTLVSVEMFQEPVIPYPRDLAAAPAHVMTAILNRGLRSSHVITYDLAQNAVVDSFMLGGSPAHVEFDTKDHAIFYLAQHHNSMVPGGVLSFGNTVINKYALRDGRCELAGRYEEELKLYRCPSVKPFTCRDEQLLVVPSWSNQIVLIDAKTMKLRKRLMLQKTSKAPDYANGPFRYPPATYDRTPYTIHAIDGSAHLLLTSVWNLSLFDFEKEVKGSAIAFNSAGHPIVAVGHSSYFPQPRGA